MEIAGPRCLLSTYCEVVVVGGSRSVTINKTRRKGPTDGRHTGIEKRSTRRSTQTDAPGPAAATPTYMEQHGTPLDGSGTGHDP